MLKEEAENALDTDLRRSQCKEVPATDNQSVLRLLKKHQTGIISFLLGCLIGGLITFTITYSITLTSENPGSTHFIFRYRLA